jgi:hypothetical protein
VTLSFLRSLDPLIPRANDLEKPKLALSFLRSPGPLILRASDPERPNPCRYLQCSRTWVQSTCWNGLRIWAVYRPEHRCKSRGTPADACPTQAALGPGWAGRRPKIDDSRFYPPSPSRNKSFRLHWSGCRLAHLGWFFHSFVPRSAPRCQKPGKAKIGSFVLSIPRSAHPSGHRSGKPKLVRSLLRSPGS